MLTTQQHERLRQFFGAYFHEDFLLDSPSPDAVVDLYLHDHDAMEIQNLAGDILHLLQETAGADLDRRLYREYGCNYLPEADRLTRAEWLLRLATKLKTASNQS